MPLDLSFINDHTVKPPFTPGQSYKAKITEVKEKPSGFTATLSFEDLSMPAFWHFNVAKDGDALRIASDELKGLCDQLGLQITKPEDLLGHEPTVRLTTQRDSNLPAVGLPFAEATPNPF